MGILDKVKKKAKKLPVADEINEQLNRVEDIITDLNNQTQSQIESIKDNAIKSVNVEIEIVKGKASYTQGLIDNLEVQVKNSLNEVVSKGEQKIDSEIAALANKVNVEASQCRTKLEEIIKGVVTTVETNAEQKLKEAIDKAEKEAMKRFESQMQNKGLVYFIKKLLGI